MGNIFQKAYRFSIMCISTIHLHQYREKQMYQELNCPTGACHSHLTSPPHPTLPFLNTVCLDEADKSPACPQNLKHRFRMTFPE